MEEAERTLQHHSLVVHLKAATSWVQKPKAKGAKHPGFLTQRRRSVSTANSFQQCALPGCPLRLAPSPQR